MPFQQLDRRSTRNLKETPWHASFIDSTASQAETESHTALSFRPGSSPLGRPHSVSYGATQCWFRTVEGLLLVHVFDSFWRTAKNQRNNIDRLVTNLFTIILYTFVHLHLPQRQICNAVVFVASAFPTRRFAVPFVDCASLARHVLAFSSFACHCSC
jgi:hypothetical protein